MQNDPGLGWFKVGLSLQVTPLCNSGVDRNVNWGASHPLLSPPLPLSPPPILTGAWGLYPRKFFFEIKGARR